VGKNHIIGAVGRSANGQAGIYDSERRKSVFPADQRESRFVVCEVVDAAESLALVAFYLAFQSDGPHRAASKPGKS